MENKSLKIGILGLGLVGGSILKSLHKTGKYTLIACSKSSYKEAEEFSNLSGDSFDVLFGCDVVFVCSKMSETKENLKKLESVLDENAIVTDVCSIKGFLDGKYKFNYVPSHPMAGSELTGFKNSFPSLFEGAKWILCKENEILRSLISEMGAKPVLIDTKEHDKLTAMISHFPTIMSFALFDLACDESKKIASSGFRDMTRLAMSDKDMAFDMLNLNRKNILDAYQKFVLTFEKIKDMDEEEFKAFASSIAVKRTEMYDVNGKNTLC